MYKSFLLLLFLVLLGGFVFSADAISNYTADANVPLGLNITATGIFTADDGNSSGVLCSFYLVDAETGVLVKRATDQYTTGTGRFTLVGYPITEPVFKRGEDYNVRTECGTATADLTFLVAQRESISHLGAQEFDYLTEPENTDTAFIWIVFGLFFLALAFGVTLIFNYARG